ncbi:MAG: tRNA (N6-threonylcarbamoyladenosine(37)-N6)-methyltransferase TrmO [Proteobacteria bacterium]|nr:tRNA (N6-threonylcarbamoyladenosine(37)-N6)-methyltransferase TrmO [Pseudomonadota bacterium]
MDTESAINMQPIGIIHSCFREKFGIPRQPGLSAEARGTLELFPPYNDINSVKELDAFSHIWILFIFHGSEPGKWRPMVRPPRLGGNTRVGVFASRSCFRPNPIGMSAVELERISKEKATVFLHLKGIDFLDKTPVIDIKPYVPYSDRIKTATDGYADFPPPDKLTVSFSDQAKKTCETIEKDRLPFLQKLITEVLGNDPRPGYYSSQNAENEFGMTLYDLNIRWQVTGDEAIVESIE